MKDQEFIAGMNGWEAGFIDGEGCLTISKQVRKGRVNPQWRVSITIANTNKESLELFEYRYGGTLRFNKEKRKSKTGKNWSDSWTWYCPQYSVLQLLDNVDAFLLVKRPQAEIIRSFCKHIQETKRAKGGRSKDGTFKGSEPLSKTDLDIRETFREEIQDLNSGKKFK